MEKELCYPRLGWLDHQHPRVIDRPVPELGKRDSQAPAHPQPQPLNTVDPNHDVNVVDVMLTVK